MKIKQETAYKIVFYAFVAFSVFSYIYTLCGVAMWLFNI